MDIHTIRRQGYDNGVNMADKYKGVNERIYILDILEINNVALYFPHAQFII